MLEPILADGEKIILKTQGSIQFRLTWQLGHLFLTNRRLIFIQVAAILWECRLDKIIDLSVRRRSWLLGIKINQLCIELNSGSRSKNVYLAFAGHDKWVDVIKENMALMLAGRWGSNGAEQESPGNA